MSKSENNMRVKTERATARVIVKELTRMEHDAFEASWHGPAPQQAWFQAKYEALKSAIANVKQALPHAFPGGEA